MNLLGNSFKRTSSLAVVTVLFFAAIVTTTASISVASTTNSGGSESYYSTLTAFAKSLGMTYTMGNPGTTISTSYIGTVDSIVFYESPGLPILSSLSSYTSGYSKSNFAYIAFSISGLNTSF